MVDGSLLCLGLKYQESYNTFIFRGRSNVERVLGACGIKNNTLKARTNMGFFGRGPRCSWNISWLALGVIPAYPAKI